MVRSQVKQVSHGLAITRRRPSWHGALSRNRSRFHFVALAGNGTGLNENLLEIGVLDLDGRLQPLDGFFHLVGG